MRIICISCVDQRPFEIHGDEGVVSFNLKIGTHHMHLTYIICINIYIDIYAHTCITIAYTDIQTKDSVCKQNLLSLQCCILVVWTSIGPISPNTSSTDHISLFTHFH